MAACKTLLDSRRDKHPSISAILRLIELILSDNIFEFDRKFYRQVGSPAMGTIMAPSHAIIFMAALEERILRSCPSRPSVWWRYIDDVFVIWTHSEERLLEFISYLSQYHPTIKFTYERSQSPVTFLNVSVSKDSNGTLQTNLYCKPTDTHQYLCCFWYDYVLILYYIIIFWNVARSRFSSW